jgi:hypothetical protein
MSGWWIVNGKPSLPVAHRVIECGRRVHANGLREDLMVRVQGRWSEWWERLVPVEGDET